MQWLSACICDRHTMVSLIRYRPYPYGFIILAACEIRQIITHMLYYTLIRGINRKNGELGLYFEKYC